MKSLFIIIGILIVDLFRSRTTLQICLVASLAALAAAGAGSKRVYRSLSCDGSDQTGVG